MAIPEIAVVRRFASIPILLLAALPAYAQTICDAYQSNYNASIFRGYVRDLTIDRSTCVGGAGMACNEKLRIQTLEVFKGNPGLETIITQFSFSNGPLMTAGHEYLIYAQAPRANGDVYAGGMEIANVPPETLAWLRAYPTAPPSVRIYGEFHNLPSSLAATQILVTLTGAAVGSRSLTTVPDTKLAYSFNDLSPGIYIISASLPDGLVAETAQGYAFDWYAHNPTSAAPRPTPTGAVPKLNEAIFSVAPKGCIRIDFTVGYESNLRGRVTTPRSPQN